MIQNYDMMIQEKVQVVFTEMEKRGYGKNPCCL